MVSPSKPSRRLRLQRFLGLLVAVMMLFSITGTALAQDYSFAVPEEQVVVYVNEDGTVSLDYTIVFENQPGAHVIDYVDLGMPNDNYDIGSITASVDGQPITDIATSEYVQPGVALGLGANAIPAGGRGTVRAYVGRVTNMLFVGSEKEAEKYVSIQFMPNYFESGFVRGNTLLTVTIVMPPGLTEQEPRYFPVDNWTNNGAPTFTGKDDKGRAYYTWEYDSASASSRYTFGAAFPARLVPETAIATAPVVQINIDNMLESACPCIFALGFFGFIGLSIYGAIVGDKKRKLKYLSPKIAVEGHGIKRGLTAVEAAVLMEQPLDKVLTMILFSLMKKNAAEVTNKEPLKIVAANPLPAELQPYETEFIEAFGKEGVERRKMLQDMMIGIVKGLTEKMRGFSRKETIDYYTDIMNRAWQQVQTADTPEVKSQVYEEVMDWTMLDRRFNDRTREVIGTGPVYMPTWWWRFDPATPRPTTMTSGGSFTTPSMPNVPTSRTVTMQMPSLPGSDFAASVVNGVQSFAGKAVGDVTAFTGGVTNKTNPVPVSTSSRSGGGSFRGGGGCACACACAGCACACAGGGR